MECVTRLAFLTSFRVLIPTSTAIGIEARGAFPIVLQGITAETFFAVAVWAKGTKVEGTSVAAAPRFELESFAAFSDQDAITI